MAHCHEVGLWRLQRHPSTQRRMVKAGQRPALPDSVGLRPYWAMSGRPLGVMSDVIREHC